MREFFHVFAYCVWHFTKQIGVGIIVITGLLQALFPEYPFVQAAWDAKGLAGWMILLTAAIMTRRYFRHLRKQAEAEDN